MSDTWLILDTNYLCHRAYYAMGHLTHEDVPTGVVYGVLQDVTNLQDLFGTERVVFTFDHGLSVRQDVDPNYKSSRKPKTDAELVLKKEVNRQIARMRDKYLKSIGYRNVFSQKGYEADDVIASLVYFSLPEGDDAVVVSADQDLWQLIGPSVLCYNPQTRKRVTLQSFTKVWGITPLQWSEVKAIAGCDGDDVTGIRGVGEKSAARWISGTLKEDSQMYQRINKGLGQVATNIELVRLPFKGTERFQLRDDRVTDERWRKFADKMGFRRLRQPTSTRGVRRIKKPSRSFGL